MERGFHEKIKEEFSVLMRALKSNFSLHFSFLGFPSSMWGQWAKCEKWKDWMECENGDNIFYLENLSFVGVYVYRHVIFVRTWFFFFVYFVPCTLAPGWPNSVFEEIASMSIYTLNTNSFFFRCVSYFGWSHLSSDQVFLCWYHWIEYDQRIFGTEKRIQFRLPISLVLKNINMNRFDPFVIRHDMLRYETQNL